MSLTNHPNLAWQHLAKMLQCGRGYVNLWGGEIGRPLSYSSVNELVRRTRELVGFHFTVHQFGTRTRRWRIATASRLR